jgi:hypothetical protein
MLPGVVLGWFLGKERGEKYHACWKEVARFNIIKRDIARHLAYSVSGSNPSVTIPCLFLFCLCPLTLR